MKRRPSSTLVLVELHLCCHGRLTVGQRSREDVSKAKQENGDGRANIQIVNGRLVLGDELKVNRSFPICESSHQRAVCTASLSTTCSVSSLAGLSYTSRKR